VAARGRSRRVSVPGVAELFRPTVPMPVTSDERQATGRERHDQKITVYLSATELLDLEHARLRLRRFGFVLDRGRLVREAIAILLADLDARGKDSLIARRIRSSQEDGQDPGVGQDIAGRGGASENGRQDKDEDAVPSLRTPFFFDVPEFRYPATGAKKKEVLWAQPQAAR
jgi:hypothetical protein